MLRLLCPTPNEWAEMALNDLPALLADHAHCEMKAAQSALSLVARFGAEHGALIEPLTSLAREEIQHFRQVTERNAALGSDIGLPRKDDYVSGLNRMVRSAGAGGRDEALLNRLLVAAFIEARSCERFDCLSRASSGDTADFYIGLKAAEARHFRLFVRLAEDLFDKNVVRERLASVAKMEAEIAAQLPLGPTVHG